MSPIFTRWNDIRAAENCLYRSLFHILHNRFLHHVLVLGTTHLRMRKRKIIRKKPRAVVDRRGPGLDLPIPTLPMLLHVSGIAARAAVMGRASERAASVRATCGTSFRLSARDYCRAQSWWLLRSGF